MSDNTHISHIGGDIMSIDPTFGVNAFNQAKYRNETETVANSILNLLFGKPGYFPSMPNLGLNIQELIYSFWDEISTTRIKAEISAQCSVFKEYVSNGSLDVIKSSYMDKPLLLVNIPVQIKDAQQVLSVGVTQDPNGNTIYNYVFNSAVS